MNLQECKDQVAHNNSFSDWEQVCRIVCVDEMQDMLDTASKLYATEKVKEALKLANDLMELDEWERLAILSLETELIELINKEK